MYVLRIFLRIIKVFLLRSLHELDCFISLVQLEQHVNVDIGLALSDILYLLFRTALIVQYSPNVFKAEVLVVCPILEKTLLLIFL